MSDPVSAAKDASKPRSDARGKAEGLLAEAALRLVRAYDANVDAINCAGHPGEPHDRMLHFDPCTADPDLHIYSASSDCAACGGAQYGTEDEVQQAIVDVKLALGEPLRPYEQHRVGPMTPEQAA